MPPAVNVSPGHAALEPVQVSATSQMPALARHTEPPVSADTNARPAIAPAGVHPLCSGGLNEPVSEQVLVAALIRMRPRPPAPPLIAQPLALPPAPPTACTVPLTVSDGASRNTTPPEPPPPAPAPWYALPPLPPLANSEPVTVIAPAVEMRSAPPPPPPPPPPGLAQVHGPEPPPPPEPG